MNGLTRLHNEEVETRIFGFDEDFAKMPPRHPVVEAEVLVQACIDAIMKGNEPSLVNLVGLLFAMRESLADDPEGLFDLGSSVVALSTHSSALAPLGLQALEWIDNGDLLWAGYRVRLSPDICSSETATLLLLRAFAERADLVVNYVIDAARPLDERRTRAILSDRLRPRTGRKAD